MAVPVLLLVSQDMACVFWNPLADSFRSAVLSGAGSMLGSGIMGFICDKAPFKTRRSRAFFALGCMTVASFAIWGAGLAWQLTVSYCHTAA